MTLDDAYISNREAVIRGHEADLARARADYEAEKLLESIEAEESRWSGIFKRMSYERPRVHYLRAVPDDRWFSVEGDLIETARRDRDVPRISGDVA